MIACYILLILVILEAFFVYRIATRPQRQEQRRKKQVLRQARQQVAGLARMLLPTPYLSAAWSPASASLLKTPMRPVTHTCSNTWTGSCVQSGGRWAPYVGSWQK